MKQYDIVIRGAGVIGCAIVRYLSRYSASMLVLEKEENVCSGKARQILELYMQDSMLLREA